MNLFSMYITRKGGVEPIYDGSIMAKNRKQAIREYFPDAIMESYYRGKCGTIGEYDVLAIKADKKL